MSDGTYASGAGQPRSTSGGASGTVASARDDLVDVKDTAIDAVKSVGATAKDEVASVAHETKAQAQELFDETRRELSDHAAFQQERIATGLGVLGDELGAMARDSHGSGIAADLVRQASVRASSAAAWLGDRDPSGVLNEVRTFARRRPAVFIVAALVAGAVAGRLTRSLIANAKDESGMAARTETLPAVAASRPPVSPGTEPPLGDAPLYAESAARFDDAGTEASRERSDTV